MPAAPTTCEWSEAPPTLFAGNETHDIFSRGDGLVLLLFFGVFLYYTFVGALRARSAGDAYIAERHEEIVARPRQRLWLSLLLTALGLLGVIGGGKWTVENAVLLARHAGVPDATIGLTFVAVGTGLPSIFIVAALGTAIHFALYWIKLNHNAVARELKRMEMRITRLSR